ncbi:MAG: hypothetical protein MJ192_05420 [Clostridia bacterium]|nr:hypothetical protein [Clostridia bacterium]
MKKLLCAALSLLLLLPLAACGPSGEETGTDAPTAPETEERATEFFPDVEKAAYNQDFQMIGFTEPGEWYYSEGLDQTVLNDAVYDMNQRVNEYLGVTLRYEHIRTNDVQSQMYDRVYPTVASGDDAYQLCILHAYRSYNAFISDNAAYDFYQLDRLDLGQSYWNSRVIDSLAINGKAYIALGALCQYSLNVLFANKNRLKDAQREVPYAKVRDGSWTLDEFISLTEGLYTDANGDGAHNSGDTYGFASIWDANGGAMLQASDIYVVTRSDDRFDLSLEGDRLTDFYGKLFAWSRDESVFLWTYNDRENSGKVLPFMENRSCFTLENLGTQFLSADFDVGVLPLPKYDKAQENYAHVNWGNNLIVPASIRDSGMVGAVLELMAFFSEKVVQEAYYDTVLQYRVSNAPDDREMVKLIYDTVVYDPGIAFCDGNNGLFNLVYLASFCITQNNAHITSFVRSNSKSAQKGLNELFKQG